MKLETWSDLFLTSHACTQAHTPPPPPPPLLVLHRASGWSQFLWCVVIGSGSETQETEAAVLCMNRACLHGFESDFFFFLNA